MIKIFNIYKNKSYIILTITVTKCVFYLKYKKNFLFNLNPY